MSMGPVWGLWWRLDGTDRPWVMAGTHSAQRLGSYFSFPTYKMKAPTGESPAHGCRQGYLQCSGVCLCGQHHV